MSHFWLDGGEFLACSQQLLGCTVLIGLERIEMAVNHITNDYILVSFAGLNGEMSCLICEDLTQCKDGHVCEVLKVIFFLGWIYAWLNKHPVCTVLSVLRKWFVWWLWCVIKHHHNWDHCTLTGIPPWWLGNMLLLLVKRKKHGSTGAVLLPHCSHRWHQQYAGCRGFDPVLMFEVGLRWSMGHWDAP